MADKKQMRFTDAELTWMKSVFGGDDDFALKTLRKIFVPKYDTDAPIGETVNPYMAVKTEGVSAEEIAISVRALNLLWGHLEVMIKQLDILAHQKDESEEEKKERLAKNSTR